MKTISVALANEFGVSEGEIVNAVGDDIYNLDAVEWALSEQFGCDLTEVTEVSDNLYVRMSG